MMASKGRAAGLIVILVLLLMTFYNNEDLLKVTHKVFSRQQQYNIQISSTTQALVTKVQERKTILLCKKTIQKLMSYEHKIDCEAECHYTTNRSRHLEADMIIFYSDDLTSINMEGISRHRPDSQLWVFHAMESPIRTYRGKLRDAIRNVSGLFNLTMSYSTEADIYTPYGYVIKRKSFLKIPSHSRKGVLWFVSNYVEFRINYVVELKKHIKVDVFGDCGERDPCGRNSKCIKSRQKKYMFYLAFENSFCDDYLTEKFWNALKSGMIPVVMGADMESYEKLAPPHSFIHVNNYKSPKHLADYLNYLHENYTAYAAYHRWRLTHSITYVGRLCTACKIAHKLHGENHIIPDITSSWSKDRYCKDPDSHKTIKNFSNSNINLNVTAQKMICFNTEGNRNQYNANRKDFDKNLMFSFKNPT